MRAGKIQWDDKRQINCTSPAGCSNSLREARCTRLHPTTGRKDSVSLTQIHNHHTHCTLLMAGGEERRRKEKGAYVRIHAEEKNPFLVVKGTFVS